MSEHTAESEVLKMTLKLAEAASYDPRVRDTFLSARERIEALESERDQLREQNRELVGVIEGHLHVFGLQALRDAADPKTLRGWEELQDQARALLAKVRP